MNLLVIFLHFGMFSTNKICFAGMHDLIPFIYNTPREMHARLLMEKDIEQFEGQLIQWHKLMLEGESPWVAYQPPQVTSEPPQTTD